MSYSSTQNLHNLISLLSLHRESKPNHISRIVQSRNCIHCDILNLAIKTLVSTIVMKLTTDEGLAVVGICSLPLWLRFGEEVEDDDVLVGDVAKEGFDGVVGPEGGKGIEQPALEHPDGIGISLRRSISDES